MAKLNFNTASAPESDFEPLEPGVYPAMVVDSEISENKKGTGSYLKVVFHILDEHYAGRRIYHYINFVHQNEKVQTIGQRQLAELCKACNIVELEDTEELHEIELNIKLKIEAGNGDYGPSNKVAKITPMQ